MLKTLARLIRMVAILAVLGMLASIAVGNPWVQRMLNPIQYQDLITVYSRRHDLDPFLVAAIMRVESRYQPDAVSSKGARGLMQLMPDTGRWAAGCLGIEGYSDDFLFEPEVNIRIGAWYLRQLLNQFEGNLTVALAAYNGGPSNVEKWLSGGRWSGSIDDLEQIPFGETARYVDRVSRAHRLYLRAYRSRWPGNAPPRVL
ncbi:MAG TPA: lytic transglycosylase domain-containing protein [Bacillota bacterium]|nr:lytic transglycosylase domain-containing protein [Bacillota bacterium]